jgi:hypothetical protein
VEVQVDEAVTHLQQVPDRPETAPMYR